VGFTRVVFQPNPRSGLDGFHSLGGKDGGGEYRASETRQTNHEKSFMTIFINEEKRENKSNKYEKGSRTIVSRSDIRIRKKVVKFSSQIYIWQLKKCIVHSRLIFGWVIKSDEFSSRRSRKLHGRGWGYVRMKLSRRLEMAGASSELREPDRGGERMKSNASCI